MASPQPEMWTVGIGPCDAPVHGCPEFTHLHVADHQLEISVAVLAEIGDVVAGLDAGGDERVCHLVRVQVELTERGLPALELENDRVAELLDLTVNGVDDGLVDKGHGSPPEIPQFCVTLYAAPALRRCDFCSRCAASLGGRGTPHRRV